MSNEDFGNITLGEIYRTLLRMEAKINAINGMVADHETRISLLESSPLKSPDPVARWGALTAIVTGAGAALLNWLRA